MSIFFIFIRLLCLYLRYFDDDSILVTTNSARSNITEPYFLFGISPISDSGKLFLRKLFTNCIKSLYFSCLAATFSFVFSIVCLLLVTEGLRAKKCLFIWTTLSSTLTSSYYHIVYLMWGCVCVPSHPVPKKDVFLNIFLLCGRNINDFFRNESVKKSDFGVPVRIFVCDCFYNLIYFKNKHQCANRYQIVTVVLYQTKTSEKQTNFY